MVAVYGTVCSIKLKQKYKGITMARTVTRKARTSERGEEAFSKVIAKSIKKGTITNKSAASKMKHQHHNAGSEITTLGMKMDQRYMTLIESAKGSKVLVRITTKNGLQKSQVAELDFDGNEKMMFAAADKVRRHILRTGKIPTKTKKANMYASVVNSFAQPEQSPTSAQPEQVSKSIDTAPKNSDLVDATLALRAATEMMLKALK